MLVTLLVLNQGKMVVHELEPAHGDQTVRLTRLITVKQIGIALNFFSLVPRLSPRANKTASDGKLGRAWERG